MTTQNGCKAGQGPLTNEQWIAQIFPERCVFYPMRDCPGWGTGGTCSRIGEEILPQETYENS